MKNYYCLQCFKKFYTEDMVKTHLLWRHNIPPYEALKKLDELKNFFKK